MSKENLLLEDMINSLVVFPIFAIVNFTNKTYQRLRAKYYKYKGIEYHWADDDILGFDYVIHYNKDKNK